MPYASKITVSPSTKAEAMEAIGVTAGLTPGNLVAVQTVDPVTHLKKWKAYGKECFHCHKKGHFSQFCHLKQHGKSPGSSVRSSSENNRFSHVDIHEIDQSQFDDSIQFEQDSITIQFRTQIGYTNVMFNEISSSPSLQRVLTDVQLKPIGVNQSHWTKQRFKIDSGACGNFMPLSMYNSLYSNVPSITSVNSAVWLLDYNKKEIKQLGTCVVNVRFRSIVKSLSFYVVPYRLKPIIGVSDALALGLTSFHCPIYTDQQSDSTNSVDSIHSKSIVNSTTREFTVDALTKQVIHSNVKLVTPKGTGTGIVNSPTQEFNMGILMKEAIINHPRHVSLFRNWSF